MKAVIMAGGEGTRLRPLTCSLPKPMARLCGRPIIEHIIDLLSRNDVDEATVTLKYMPEVIRENFPNNEYFGVKLHFSEEDKPLGTAGGICDAVGKFEKDFSEFLVISGDAMCDFNLKAAMEFHHEKKADATLILSHVSDPREFGLVLTDPSGAVKGFIEKPGWAQAVTDAVNTGIYIINKDILPLIPKDRQYDFAKDLFPLMLSRGMRLYGFEADGYWCDIGDIGAYTSCQFDMLEGRVDCRFEGFNSNGVYHKGRIPSGNYSIKPPVYIGENVSIGDFSVIGPYAVIDDWCTIGEDVSIKNSVMLPGAYAGDHCELRGALVCSGASLKRRAGMFEGSVAGENSVIGADAAVSPGVRIWPGKRVEDGARAAVNIKTGCARHGIFDDEGITGEVGADLTPESCARIGAAVGGVTEQGRIGICCDGSIAGNNLKNAVAAGILSAGAEFCDFGVGFESLFNFSLNFFGLDMGIFVRMSGNRAVIELTGPAGLGIGRSAERKIESAFTTGQIRRCAALEYREPFYMPGIKEFYTRELVKKAPKGFDCPVTVKSANREIQSIFSRVLKDCDCHSTAENGGGVCVHIDTHGTKVSFICEDGSIFNSAQALAAGCLAAFDSGEDVALPSDAPNIIDAIAQKKGCHVMRYLGCPADKSDAKARALAAKQMWVRDGLENALRVLSYAAAHGMTLAQLKNSLPQFAVTEKSVACTVNPGLLLRGFRTAASGSVPEGVALVRGHGRVLIRPLKRGTGLKIIAEAENMEVAEELRADIERELHDNIQAIDKDGK